MRRIGADSPRCEPSAPWLQAGQERDDQPAATQQQERHAEGFEQREAGCHAFSNVTVRAESRAVISLSKRTIAASASALKRSACVENHS